MVAVSYSESWSSAELCACLDLVSARVNVSHHAGSDTLSVMVSPDDMQQGIQETDEAQRTNSPASVQPRREKRQRHSQLIPPPQSTPEQRLSSFGSSRLFVSSLNASSSFAAISNRRPLCHSRSALSALIFARRSFFVRLARHGT